MVTILLTQSAPSVSEDYDWVQQYFNGGYGITDKYEWLRMIARHKMNGFKPKPYAQVYTTRRMGISMR